MALIGAGLGLLIAGSINASRSHEDDDSYDYYPSTSPSSGVAGSYSNPLHKLTLYDRGGVAVRLEKYIYVRNPVREPVRHRIQYAV